MFELVDAFFALFGEGFLKLYTAFLPKKTLSECAKQRLCVLLCVLGSLFLTGMIVGIVLVCSTEGKSVLGWVLLVLGALYAAIAITLKLKKG